MLWKHLQELILNFDIEIFESFSDIDISLPRQEHYDCFVELNLYLSYVS